MEGYTIFIPVLNEADILASNVGRLVAYLEGLDRPFQIIIGSNGSTDATLEIGPELARRDERITFFHLPDRGPGSAFKEGLRLARFRKIISQDADLSVDLSFIPRAIELLDEYELVIGSKKMGTQKRSWLRITGSGSFILAARLLLGIRYQDYSLAAKGYHQNFALENRAWIDRHTAYVLNLTSQAHRQGRRIIEVPVSCEDGRGSRFNLLNEGIYRFGRLFGLWFRERFNLPPEP